MYFRAIKDYDPRYFSRSGRQHAELSLSEGAVVKPLGNTDSSGYIEVQCNNKVGLVPAAYLEPIKDNRYVSQKQFTISPSTSYDGAAVNGGIEHVVQVHNEAGHVTNATGKQQLIRWFFVLIL